MQNTDKFEEKQQSFIHSFGWVAAMLAIIGGALIVIALVIQVIPLDPEKITVNISGTRHPSTEETLDMFRRIFLLSFGIPGIGMLLTGGGVLAKRMSRLKTEEKMKKEGTHIEAEVTGYPSTFVEWGQRFLARLECTYTTIDGKSHVFKSRLLRADPSPFLENGKVNVYYNKENPKQYFVDVDGSIEPDDKFVEKL